MSEFRVVKCKKCDAALTELFGEKLTRCVQCGYKFALTTKPVNRIYNTSVGKRAIPEVAGMVKKLRQLNNTKAIEATIATKSTEFTPPKKKSNPIVTIIIWIIVLSIARGIFFN